MKYTRIEKLNEQLDGFMKNLKEELDKDVHYEFTFERTQPDLLVLTSGESEYPVQILDEDGVQEIKDAIDDFVDIELAADMDDAENITGTEVAGFKYDEETGKGSFEANIFFEEDPIDVNEDIEEENEKAEKKRKFRIYTAAWEALENLTDLIEEEVDPETKRLEPDLDHFYDEVQKTLNEIYSRSKAFED